MDDEHPVEECCSYCGEWGGGIEIEYCDTGEHCEMCCTNYPYCED